VGQRRGASAPAVSKREFCRTLECGILAHGFARARCADCGHNSLITCSRQCCGVCPSGVCPSGTTRRMVETAAHLADEVIPRRPVRQWVLSVPRRLREIDPEHLVHASIKPGPGGRVSLMRTLMPWLDPVAALIPSPRRHRPRTDGVLVPNSPLREAVTAPAPPSKMAAAPTTAERIRPQAAPPAPAHRQAARYAGALLLARIDETLPLLYPKCGGEMRPIAFISEAVVIRKERW